MMYRLLMSRIYSSSPDTFNGASDYSEINKDEARFQRFHGVKALISILPRKCSLLLNRIAFDV